MNNKIKLSAIFLMMTLSISSLHAQTSIQEITQTFFRKYEQSPEEATSYAFGTNQWIADKNKAGIESVKNKLMNAIKLVGNYNGYEKITEKGIGKSYKLISYLIKYDRQPIRFTFLFYKPKDTWRVQNFRFDDDLSDELREAAKIYQLSN